jgi:TIR domain-containing protein
VTTGVGGGGSPERWTGQPLRIVAIVPSPSDTPAFDAEGAWQDLSDALKGLEAQHLIALDRVVPATEQALKQRLARETCHVVHFIGHASWRAAARYGTLTFESSSRAARSVTTPYLGNLLAQYQSVGLTVLQPCAHDSAFDASPATLWDRGPAVLICEGTPRGRPQAVFAARLYASLATGATLQEAATHARTGLVDVTREASLVLKGAAAEARLVATAPAAAVAASVVPPAQASVTDRPQPDSPGEDAAARAAAAELEAARAAARRELLQKRASAEFDVFLCHNWADKASVRRIADRLEEHGILPWLDERELPPGQPWQQLLEKQIARIRSAAVFVGAAGVGPWQEQELYGFLREFVSRRSPVIPVLLPDAPDKPELPIFLKAMTWVDFRLQDPEPLSRLIWGITGQRPSLKF